jgi:hypothetical protein
MIAERCKPRLIVSDTCSEFTSNALLRSPSEAGIVWRLIAPGRGQIGGRSPDLLFNERAHGARRRRTDWADMRGKASAIETTPAELRQE